VRRHPERGRYDRETLNAILDAGLFCHVAYAHESAPVVTPTLYWRDEDHLYWHGSAASRMLDAVDGAEVSIAVTHFDGLVVARSAFHHSANYRSAMLFGRAEAVTDDGEKRAAMEALVNSIFPGRWSELRPMTDKEIKATKVLRLRIDEFSVKIRSGPSKEDAADLDWPAWAGVIPYEVSAGSPQRDASSAPLPAPTPLRPAAQLDAPAANRLRFFQVNAFVSDQFKGNPAGVVMLERELEPIAHQSIAAELGLPATAFVIRTGDPWSLRWFTPTEELPLCGHGTLAAAFVLLDVLLAATEDIRFETARSGVLTARKTPQGVALDLPLSPIASALRTPAVDAALNGLDAELLASKHNYVAVFGDAERVIEFRPDMRAIAALDRAGLIITAQGDSPYDCVSRYFAPRKGVDEDAVTGSAHCALAPYWSRRLDKQRLRAWQASKRGGELLCAVEKDRVALEGRCRLIASGAIDGAVLEGRR
jgi:predicted PhzF superfamily epimerase YddE/YHI9/nitroimidazol reductase NimA-like FMN-containing flavoprotein (pyridoxamine 5'-phosphate oxidase superfamily)